jgi:hypothetical protein
MLLAMQYLCHCLVVPAMHVIGKMYKQQASKCGFVLALFQQVEGFSEGYSGYGNFNIRRLHADAARTKVGRRRNSIWHRSRNKVMRCCRDEWSWTEDRIYVFSTQFCSLSFSTTRHLLAGPTQRYWDHSTLNLNQSK